MFTVFCWEAAIVDSLFPRAMGNRSYQRHLYQQRRYQVFPGNVPEDRSILTRDEEGDNWA